MGPTGCPETSVTKLPIYAAKNPINSEDLIRDLLITTGYNYKNITLTHNKRKSWNIEWRRKAKRH